MKIVLRILLILALLGGLGWTMYFLYSKNQKEPVRFETEQAFHSTIVKKTVATGKVVPRKEIALKPQVSGIIDRLYVEPGDKVKEGQIIARIKVIPNVLNLNQAENRVKLSEISLENARRDYDRNKQLYEEGVIPVAQFQNFELTFQNAQAELQAAKDNLQIIRQGSTSRGSSTATTLVRSTISGTVLDVPIEVGNSVIEANTFNEGTTVASVADMDEMIFEGQVDESEVGKLEAGMELVLTIGALTEERFPAKLEFIAPKGVEENGAVQFEIRAALELNDNQSLRANYSANADIVLDRRDSVLVIPESLLQFESDERAYVEVERGDQDFEKVYVRTGLSDGINVEVLDGVDKEMEIKNPNKRL